MSPPPTGPTPPDPPAGHSSHRRGARPAQPLDPRSAARPGSILCPYCGTVSGDPRRCERCRGHFDPLSRQASQNSMGPWFLHDAAHPFRPGCSYETLRELIRRGRVSAATVLRGPATRQFWSFAGRTPGIANLLGLCHNCQAAVSPDAYACAACGAVFTPETDRQHLGLAPVHLLPGQAAPEIIAAAQSPEAVAAARRAADAAAGLTGAGVAARSMPVSVTALEERRSRLPVVVAAVAAGVLVGLGSAAVIFYAVRDDLAAGVAMPTVKPEAKPLEGAAPEPAHAEAPAVQPAAEPAPERQPGPTPEEPGAPAAAPAELPPDPAPGPPERLRRLP